MTSEWTMAEEREAAFAANATRALRLAVRHINAPLRNPIDEADALRWLRENKWSPREEEHAKALMDETHPTTFTDLVLGRAVSWRHLHTAARLLLPERHPTRVWLAETSSA